MTVSPHCGRCWTWPACVLEARPRQSRRGSSMTRSTTPLAAAPAVAAQSGAGSRPLAQSRAQHDRMANAIRVLAMDAVEQAKSGHPGLPMGAADVATVLFTRFLKFDPAD